MKSGHAVWVGNLPYYARLQDLCQIFGSNDIQSIFLIQRTQRAFINYTSSEAVNHILEKFQDNAPTIHGRKLIIKLRENRHGQREQIEQLEQIEQIKQIEQIERNERKEPNGQAKEKHDQKPQAAGGGDRFFICKSLTEEDLDASARLGMWSTQSHNEQTFNGAFCTCENVYLIFSANRTGEFYGYARMECEIKKEDCMEYFCRDVHTEEESSASPLDDSNSINGDDGMQPKIVPTAADESIPLPAGRIVDDSVRGSLFWEIVEQQEQQPSSSTSSNKKEDLSSRNWSKPFKIKWLSPRDKRLPFTKTNHLYNPLNANQLVKVAKDGTEVEPSVGQQLIKLFYV